MPTENEQVAGVKSARAFLGHGRLSDLHLHRMWPHLFQVVMHMKQQSRISLPIRPGRETLIQPFVLQLEDEVTEQGLADQAIGLLF